MKLHWRLAAAGLLLGLTLGGLAGSCAQRRSFRRYWTRGSDTARALNNLDKKLHLDASQKTAITAVLESRQKRMDAFRKETAAAFLAIRRDARDAIRKTLNAEQQKEFDALGAAFEARHKDFFHGAPR